MPSYKALYESIKVNKFGSGKLQESESALVRSLAANAETLVYTFTFLHQIALYFRSGSPIRSELLRTPDTALE